MGIYLFYLVVSGLPFIARVVVVAFEAETGFNWQDIMAAEQPFWFAAVLSLTTLLRLSDSVRDPQQDFSVPGLYNLVRSLLFVTGIVAIISGGWIGAASYSRRALSEETVYSIAVWIVLFAMIFGAAQVGIRNRQP